MSTRIVAPPGVTSGYWRLAFALVSLLGVAACSDAPQSTQGFDPTAAFAPPPTPQYNIEDCSTSGLGDAATGAPVTVQVLLSNGSPAVGATVTAFSSTRNGRCWGATSSTGHVVLDDLTGDILLSVRDYLSPDAVQYEIVPTSSDPDITGNLEDAPTIASPAQQPVLVAGSRCQNVVPLTWSNYAAYYNQMCGVKNNGLNLTVQLPSTTQTHTIRIVGPDGPSGPGIDNIAVAALSPWSMSFDQNAPGKGAACDLLAPDLRDSCNNDSFGAAMWQAADLTANGGYATFPKPAGNFLIEAVGEITTGTETFVLYGTLTGAGDLRMSPAMCKLSPEKIDESNPVAVPEMDIKSVQYSSGMDSEGIGATLMRDLTEAIVEVRIVASGDGGAGQFEYWYKPVGSSSSLKIAANFAINHLTEACSFSSGTGTGVTAGAGFVGYCTQDTLTDEYVLFFIVTDLPTDRDDSAVSLKTDDDHYDPQRSGSYRSNIPLLDEYLLPDECTVYFNNDARWTSGG